MRVQLLKQLQVVLAKTHGSLACRMGFVTQQLQHTAGAAQAGLEQLALHPHHAPVAQLVPVGHIARPRHDLKLRKVCLRQVHNFQRLLHIVHRHHQHLGRGSTRGAQQVQPGGVAIKHAVTDVARHFDHLGVVVQHSGGNAFGREQAADDLAVAAKAGNHDGGLLLFRDFFHRRHITVGIAWQQQPVHCYQNQRAQQHGHGHRTNQQRGSLGREHIRTGGRLKHHKRKLTALRQQQREHRPLLKGQLNVACQRIDHQPLDGQKAQHHQCHEARRLHQHSKVDAHAYGNEEQTQQQPLEGFDVGFQLAPVLTFGQ